MLRHQCQQAKTITHEAYLNVEWICHLRSYDTENRHSQETAVSHQGTHFNPCCEHSQSFPFPHGRQLEVSAAL